MISFFLIITQIVQNTICMLLGYFNTPGQKQCYSRICFRAFVSRSNLFFKQNKSRRNTNQCSFLIKKKRLQSLQGLFHLFVFHMSSQNNTSYFKSLQHPLTGREFLIFFWAILPCPRGYVHTANKQKVVFLTFSVLSALCSLS